MIDRRVLVKLLLLLLLHALLTGCRAPESTRTPVDVGRHSIDRDAMKHRREQSLSTNEVVFRKKSPIITVSAESKEESVASPIATKVNSLELPTSELDGSRDVSPLAEYCHW